jgi:hypothetical protein
VRRLEKTAQKKTGPDQGPAIRGAVDQHSLGFYKAGVYRPQARFELRFRHARNERHRESARGKATNGSSGEAGKTKMAELTRDGKCRQHDCAEESKRGQQQWDEVGMAVQAAAVMAAAGNGGASSAGRDKGIGGGGEEGVLTWFSWGCAQMATYLLCLSRRSSALTW